MQLALLTYSYVDGMLDKRAPHREAHLALAERMLGEGRLLIVGATGDGPDGAVIAFSDREAAEEFVAADPYGAAGLVTDHKIEPWTIVLHRPLA